MAGQVYCAFVYLIMVLAAHAFCQRLYCPSTVSPHIECCENEIKPYSVPHVDGRIIFRFSRCRIGVMGWIVLAQDRDSWRALVNAVMNFRVPQSEEFLD